VRNVNKTLLLRFAGVLVFLAVCWLARMSAQSEPPGAPPWYSIIPPLLAVTLALVTNRILFSLGAAVLVGGLLSVPSDCSGPFQRLMHRVGAMFVYHSVAETGKQQILLYVVLIMAMISVMLVAGGLQGVANWLMRLARSVRSTQLVTIAAGLVIFIDDYANTMIVGSTLRPMTDQQRISREKLAFLVDATAAPVAGIAIISTWIGHEVGLLSDVAGKVGLAKNGYEMFFDAMGFRFYCIGMIAFVLLNAWMGEDFGPMGKAERRARKQGKLLDDGARPMTSQSLTSTQPHPKANVQAMVAIVPMAALFGFFVLGLWFGGGGMAKLASDATAPFQLSAWREVLSIADSTVLLVYASGIGLAVAMVLAHTVSRIPVSAAANAVWTGTRASLFPVTVLVLAWSLNGACKNLQTGEFLAHTLGSLLRPALFPALVFVVAGLTSFATGTSWGTMGILIPIAVRIAFKLDGDIYGLVTVLSVAAVLDGAIFGDHCSPLSDTTIMSSAASACDHLAHVRTQLPYSLVVAGLALFVGYLPAGLGASKWVGILGGAAISAFLFSGLWALRIGRDGA
jgi:Na+/H+ antiporter NhaC